MKEFIEYAKSKGIKSIDIDTLCLISTFLKKQESKQSFLNGVVASVLCLDNEDSSKGITIGKKYKLIKEDEISYYIINDLGYGFGYYKRRFKKL